MKRWGWSVLLLVAAMAALTVGAAAADSDIVVQNRIRYDLSTGTVLGGENNRITEAKIKDAVRGTKITSIADGAFSGYEGLGSLTIPSSIRAIGENAFRNCEKLSTVVIPENVTKVGDGAFYGCTGLKTLTFRDKVVLNDKGVPVVQQVTEIGSAAFAWCENLQNLTLSGSISVIGDNAFSKCDKMLTKVIIPAGVTKIGELAFGQCSKLSVISIPATVGKFADVIFGGNTNLKVVHYGGKVEDILPGLPSELKGAAGEEGKYVHSTTSLLPNAKAPSCTKDGSVEESVTCPQKCTGLDSDRTLPKLEHDYSWTKSVDTATPHPCQDQSWTYTGTCNECGNVKTEIEIIGATASHQEHETTEDEQKDEKYIKELVEPTCGTGGHKIVVTKVCTVCGKELETKNIELPASGKHPSDKEIKTRKTITEATCGKDGEEEVTVTCGVCNTQVRVVLKPIPATGKHEWGEPEYVETTPATCKDEGEETKVQRCKICQAENPAYTPDPSEKTRPIGKLPHTFDEDKGKRDEKIETNATCTTVGKKTFTATCKVCGEEYPGEEEIPATGHKPQKKDDVIQEATCTTPGKKHIYATVCEVCGELLNGEDREEVIPALGHNWDAPVKDPDPKDKDGNSVKDKDPTCGDEGVAYVIVVCTVCGETEHREIKLPATGQHTWGEWKTEDGKETRTCSVCGKTDTRTLSPTDPDDPDNPDNPDNPDDPDNPSKPEETTYKVDVVQASNGTTSVSRSTAKAGEQVTVTVAPSSGCVLDMIRVIGGSQLVSLTNLGNNQYRFTMPAADVEVRATYDRTGSDYSGNWTNGFGSSGSGSRSDPRRTTDVMPVQIQEPSVGPAGASERLFQDIPTDHWAAGEVNWASQMGYMNGTGNRFNPDGNISQQQMWMVLARLSGTQPANMAEARRWAELGGYADGSSPTGPVKRHQLVNALYRCARLSGRAGRTTTSLAGYPDSRTVPAVAREAFTWALSTGVVSGDAEGRLKPNDFITRAQFAVILYRYSTRT